MTLDPPTRVSANKVLFSAVLLSLSNPRRGNWHYITGSAPIGRRPDTLQPLPIRSRFSPARVGVSPAYWMRPAGPRNRAPNRAALNQSRWSRNPTSLHPAYQQVRHPVCRLCPWSKSRILSKCYT